MLENVVPAGEVFPALPELMGMIGESAVAKDLYKEFGTQVQTFQKQHKIGGYAIAQEVCTRTLEDTSVIRLHFHAWLRFALKASGKGRILELKDWFFQKFNAGPIYMGNRQSQKGRIRWAFLSLCG